MSTPRRSSAAPWALLGISCLVVVGGAAVRARPAPVPAPVAAPSAAPAPALVAPVSLPVCDGAVATTAHATGDDRSRAAAQRGLDFLADSTVSWQGQNGCYGCHVQAVTLKAMAVGRDHDYDVDQEALDTVVKGLTTLPGGSRSAGGLRYADGIFLSAAKSLGGAAFAEYDASVGPAVREDLTNTAAELRALQGEDGAIRNDYTSPPVAIGALQDTVLAMQTWNQAYARTADDAWLTPVGRAEDWLSGQIHAWGTAPPDLQSVNYAIAGLHAARSGSGEATSRRLVDWLLEGQNDDGGWPLLRGNASDAYATGQTLYALRLMGRTEADPVVARGTRWLVEHQGEAGGWSDSGRERAEAMWAVMGLVSVDVLSLAVEGLGDGGHVQGVVPVRATARDNEGGGVVQVELRVDDMAVHRACGDTLAYDWPTASLPTGAHVVDLVATNAAGETARRRLTVYAGDHWMTRIGTRYDAGATEITLRNLAADPNRVRLTVHRAVEEGGVEKPGPAVWTEERAGAQGAMSFRWLRTDPAGAEGDRFFARLAWLDAAGAVRQTEEVLFVHDTAEAQQQRYAQVAGQLNLDRLGGAGSAATRVELVDGDGNVVATTESTEEGQYRFKNVRSGAYAVRVAKEGFVSEDAPVVAAPAASPAPVDLLLK